MKNNLIIISVLILIKISSCKDEVKSFTPGKVIVSGQITDSEPFVEVKLFSALGEFVGDSKTLPNQNGIFKFTLNLPTRYEFTLSYKNTSANLLISPGDSLFLKIDQQIDPPINISGQNRSFLREMNVINNSMNHLVTPFNDLIKKFQNDTPEQYLIYRKNLYNGCLDSLENIFFDENTPTELKEAYYSIYRVQYGFDLLRFLSMASVYQDDNYTKDRNPENYYNTIDSLFQASLQDYWVRDYQSFLSLYTNIKATQTNDTLIMAIQKKDKLLSSVILMEYYIENYSGYQENSLISFNINTLIDNGYINDEVFYEYTGLLTIDFFRSFLEKKYSEYELIQNTRVDTNKVHLNDISISDTISLFETLKKDHIGKTLYVDIWGTWCGSCISGFAYLPQFKKSLADEKIEFVYLALSSPVNQWRKVILNHKLEGHHYLLNNKQKEELYNTVEINGIPHFLIVDQTGIIIIPDAKSPYETELVEQLKGISLN